MRHRNALAFCDSESCIRTPSRHVPDNVLNFLSIRARDHEEKQEDIQDVGVVNRNRFLSARAGKSCGPRSLPKLGPLVQLTEGKG